PLLCALRRPGRTSETSTFQTSPSLDRNAQSHPGTSFPSRCCLPDPNRYPALLLVLSHPAWAPDTPRFCRFWDRVYPETENQNRNTTRNLASRSPRRGVTLPDVADRIP